MSNEKLGVLIGAIFGLIFIWVNAGELSSALATSLRVLGVVALLGLAGLMVMTRSDASAVTGDSVRRVSFGRGYALVVVAEVVALAAGLMVGDAPSLRSA
jgi:hypothetical protein